MKRRILSTLTALALCLSLCPSRALAEEWASVPEGGAEEETVLCPHGEEEECSLCRIEDLTDTLPPFVTEDNAEAVRTQLDGILALYTELTEEQQDQADLSLCYELQEQLDAAHTPVPAFVWTVTEGSDTTFDLNGKNGMAFKVIGGNLSVFNGTILGVEIPLEVESGTLTVPGDKGTLTVAGTDIGLKITGGDTTVAQGSFTGGQYGVFVTGGSVSLSGGTFTGAAGAISSAIGAAALLANHGDPSAEKHYAYFAGGEPVRLADNDALPEGCTTVTVEECTHPGALRDLGDGTHGGTCPYCLTEFDAADHTLGADGRCEGCGVDLVAEVNGSRYFTGIETAWDAALAASPAAILLLADTASSRTLEINAGNITFNAGSHTLTCAPGDVFHVTGGTLKITGGAIKSAANGVTADGGRVEITGGTIEAAGTGLLLGSSGGTAVISGGRFSGGVHSIFSAAGSLRDLLDGTAGTRYAYYRNSALVTSGLDGESLTGLVEVKPCTHAYQFVSAEPGAHVRTCPACGEGADGTAEACAFTWSGNAGTCGDCGAAVRLALSGAENLVYDKTAKTPAVRVSFKAGGAAAFTDLEAGTYTAVYQDNVNAGTAGVTVSLGRTELQTLTFPIARRPVSVKLPESLTWEYSGSRDHSISQALMTIEGVVSGDSVVVSANARASGSDAGTYDSVEVSFSSLMSGGGAGDYKNYTLTTQDGTYPISLTITKAALNDYSKGELLVTRTASRSYTLNLETLLPVLPFGLRLGSVHFHLGDVSLSSGYYNGDASVTGSTLTLPIQAGGGNEETLGTVKIVAASDNYQDFTVTVAVKGTDQTIPEGEPVLSSPSITYGQAIGSVTLSGTMTDPATGAEVPGTFAWDERAAQQRPDAMDVYPAAWTFTPEDTDQYATVTGSSVVRVLPASLEDGEITLTPAAFRYDGEAHSPEVTVAVNGRELYSPADCAVELPSGTEPGTYTVVITGVGNYTGTVTRTFSVNPVKTEEFEDGGTALKLEVETGLSSVPDGLKNTDYDTVEKIETTLRTAVQEVMSNAGDHIAVYDVTLQYRDEHGVWQDVTPDNFPAGGVTAVLPYPTGTGASGWAFSVRHMISSGSSAGEVETLAYTLTADGLQCRFSSLSPVAIGYEAVTAKPDPVPPPAPVPTPTPDPGPSRPGGGSGNKSHGSASASYAVTIAPTAHGKITSSHNSATNNATVTLTVSPASGYALDTLTVTDSQGNAVKLIQLSATRYFFTMPGQAVTVSARFTALSGGGDLCGGGADCPSRSFTDLDGGWYHEAVDYVLRKGLMGGYGDGLFGPDHHLTRAQLVQILYNAAGKPASGSGSFADVPDGMWCAAAVGWASSQGIVSGYGGGVFGPNDRITREQLAVLLWRYAGSPAAAHADLPFTDAGEAGSYSLEALRWAVEQGVVNGYRSGQLAPKGLATRAQAAQMLKNYMER